MKKIDKVLPALTLATLIAASCVSQTKDAFFTDTYTEPSTTFIEDDASIEIENNLRNTLKISSMVPQGISISDEYIFISMYDYNHINNSIIQAYSKDGSLLNTCTLHNKAHVGGISYDPNNKILWTSSILGNVDAYTEYNILHKDSANPIYKDLYLGGGLNSYNNPFASAVSYLTTYNDSIFVGNFTIFNKGTIKEYKMSFDEDRTVHLKEKRRFIVPNRVQGISFYEKDDETYMILSRSCGPKDASTLQIFKYNEKTNDYTQPVINSRRFAFPPMIEQITISGDRLYSLYESQSNPYEKKTKKEKTLQLTRINDLFK